MEVEIGGYYKTDNFEIHREDEGSIKVTEDNEEKWGFGIVSVIDIWSNYYPTVRNQLRC
jgi:hypothetical protein